MLTLEALFLLTYCHACFIAYHCKCIDPWFLVEGKRNCPLCKHSIDTDDSNQAAASHETPVQNSSMPNVVVDMNEQASASNFIDRHNNTFPTSVLDSSAETLPLVK